MRGDQSSHNGFEIRRLNLTHLDEVVRPMFDQNNPTKGSSQENDKPSQKAQDGREHREQFQVRSSKFEVLGQAFYASKQRESQAPPAAYNLQPKT